MSFLIVTGMHRSNTSLLGSLLSRSGVPFGDDLVQGSEFNPYGHYEDVELLRLHRRILAENGSSWRPWFRERFDFTEADFNEAGTIVLKRRAELGEPWGFKVPDAALLLPMWARFPDARFVFIFRKPRDVLRSLLRRVGRQLYYKPYYPINCLLTYCIYNRLIADFHARHRDRSYLMFSDDLLSAPRLVLADLAKRLGFIISEVDERLIDPTVLGRGGSPLANLVADGLASLPACRANFERLLGQADTTILLRCGKASAHDCD